MLLICGGGRLRSASSCISQRFYEAPVNNVQCSETGLYDAATRGNCGPEVDTKSINYVDFFLSHPNPISKREPLVGVGLLKKPNQCFPILLNHRIICNMMEFGSQNNVPRLDADLLATNCDSPPSGEDNIG